MKGIELFRQRMYAKGATKQMLEAKVVSLALDVLSESDNHAELFATEADIRDAEKCLESVNDKIRQARHELEEVKYMIKVNEDALSQRENDIKDYVERFEESVRQLETPEARDRLRTAQVFVNSVKVESAGSNSAFISGLAALLVGCEIGKIEAFKKLDKDVELVETRSHSYRAGGRRRL